MLLCNYKKGEKMKKFKKKERNEEIDIIFEVNENNVKEEWTRQAALYQEYCIKSIKAVKTKNKLSLVLDIAIAGLDKKIREKPSKYFPKGAKITESGIGNIIEFDEEIGKIKQDLLEKEYNVSLYSNVLKSLEHRKKALEFFGQIYLMSLYSEPNELALTDSRIRKRLNRLKGGEKG